MKTDLFLHPLTVSEINLCMLIKPEKNHPIGQQSNRSSFGISYHISTETKSIYKTPHGNGVLEENRGARTLAFIPKGSSYDIHTVKVGYSACINFQLADTHGAPLPKIPFFINVTDPIRVERLMTEAAKAWLKKDPGYLYKCNACLQELLGYMENQLSLSYLTSNQSRCINESIKYINEHFTSDRISVSFLAKNAGVSETYFRKKFKEHIGISPAQYIRSRRVEWAKELIVSSGLTMEAIADEAGYNDISHFCHEFRRCTGMSPTEYRKQILCD